ncbi:hypothetical protein [Clavibacter michiganensis]|uniref:hypothetical protein n=1 Tax=Clavibacter michiganensis TaxID=28447 RepID=UPI001365C5A8|nr:hypothetical protein [Clavibacter michiganensis]MWJ14175.1 hypothetical protein [Clavibacter michiganensis subsp. michiganensis]MWJ49069.1 hypothetical protein [Clavibacter michiganensis subsp. michiganensis]
MDALTLMLLAITGAASLSVVVLVVLQATRWSRRTRAVKRLIAEREHESDQAVIARLDERMVDAAGRLAALSLVTSIRQGWALLFAAVLFLVSGGAATVMAISSADPATGTPALAFGALCLVLVAGSLVAQDRLLEARRSEYLHRVRARNESAEDIARDYY